MVQRYIAWDRWVKYNFFTHFMALSVAYEDYLLISQIQRELKWKEPEQRSVSEKLFCDKKNSYKTLLVRLFGSRSLAFNYFHMNFILVWHRWKYKWGNYCATCIIIMYGMRPRTICIWIMPELWIIINKTLHNNTMNS